MFHRHPLLGLPTVRLLSLIAFCGQLYFFVPFMTPYLVQRHLSLAEIAGLQTALMLAMLVMEIPTGVIADRVGHVWSYRIGLIVLASGEFLFLFARDYWVFLVIQVITGTGFAFGSGSVDAILFDTLPAGDRLSIMQRAKGLLGGATQTGSVVAYSIGGLIAADLTLSRITITIVLGALAVSTAAALSFGLREAPQVRERERPNSRALLGDAWRAIRSSRSLQKVIVLAVITNAFGAHLLVFYQEYFLVTGVPGVWLGLGLSLASVVVVVSQVMAWRLSVWLGTGRAMLATTVLPGLLYLAMAINGFAWLAVVLFVLQWGAIHISGPLFGGLYNIHLPDHARATALSVINALVTVYIGFGGIVLGELAEWSLPRTFAGLGIVIIVGGIVLRVDNSVALAPETGNATS